MILSLQDTYEKILNEAVDLSRISSQKDSTSIANKFTTKPQGIVITDSYNNPFFPIQPKPRIDTSVVDILELYRRFRELYSQFSVVFLPWHYIIEFVDDRYYIFCTRPIDMKFPMTNNEVSDGQRGVVWDDDTKNFMIDKVFDISEMIHILIIGDSYLDVYTKKFYELIGRICITPIIRFFKLPESIGQRIFFFNIGSKLNRNLIVKFVRKF